MVNPSMVPPGPGMAGQAMVPSSSGQMNLRAPRPPAQTGSLFFSFFSTSNVDWIILHCTVIKIIIILLL